MPEKAAARKPWGSLFRGCPQRRYKTRDVAACLLGPAVGSCWGAAFSLAVGTASAPVRRSPAEAEALGRCGAPPPRHKPVPLVSVQQAGKSTSCTALARCCSPALAGHRRSWKCFKAWRRTGEGRAWPDVRPGKPQAFPAAAAESGRRLLPPCYAPAVEGRLPTAPTAAELLGGSCPIAARQHLRLL